MDLTDTASLILIISAATLLGLFITLVYLLFRGEPTIHHRRTRVGVFLERDQTPILTAYEHNDTLVYPSEQITREMRKEET